MANDGYCFYLGGYEDNLHWALVNHYLLPWFPEPNPSCGVATMKDPPNYSFIIIKKKSQDSMVQKHLFFIRIYNDTIKVAVH